MVNAPLTEPLLKWLSHGATWGDDDVSREQFRRGVLGMMHNSLLSLHRMQEVPMCGPEPDWSGVQRFVTEAGKKTLRMFPRTGVAQVYGNRAGDDHDTEDALSLKQGRLLFLRAVKESYESQEASGMLRWTAAATLTHIADALDDSITTSSQVRREVSDTFYFCFCFSVTKSELAWKRLDLNQHDLF